MPLGAFRINSLAKSAAEGGGITTTTLFTLDTAISGVYDNGWGGYQGHQLTWQGTFNTNYGVFLVTWLNSARSTYYLTPGVIDFTNGDIAMGSDVSIGSANTGATTGFTVAAKPGSTFGLVGGPIWNGTDWDGTWKGYTLSGTSSASTSSVPTVSLSSALTDTGSNNFFSGNVEYAGNDRFVFVNRYGSSDLSYSWYISYAGTGTPSYFNSSVNYGTSRSTGVTVSFYDGLNSSYASSYSNTRGNNSNFTDLYISCASSSTETDFEDNDRLDCSPTNAISGTSFCAAKAYDNSSTWIGMSSVYSSQAGQKFVAEKITSLTPSSITVSSGSVLSATYQLYDMNTLDSNGTVRGIVNNGSGTWFNDYTINSSTMAITEGTPYQVDTTTYNPIEGAVRNYVDATHGEWTMWGHKQGSNSLRICAAKVV